VSDAPLPRPSTLRVLAASYLDVLVVSAAVYVIESFAGGYRHHWVLTIIAFAVAQPTVLQMFPRTIGHLAMGLVRHGLMPSQWSVEPHIEERSNRVIRVVVVVLFYTGHRILAEGVLDYDFFYLAGHRLDAPLSRFYLGLVALLWATAAVGLGRLRPWAPGFAIALQALLLVNDLASLPLMREVAAMALARASERAGGTLIRIDPVAIMWTELVASAATLLLLGLGAVLYRQRFQGGDR
jgi:hypothetical protein